jgi:MoxR-like ATPase
MPKLVDRSVFLNAVKSSYGDIDSITRQQVLDVCAENNLDLPNWLLNDTSLRIARGVYSLNGPSYIQVKSVPVKVAKVKTVAKPLVQTVEVSSAPVENLAEAAMAATVLQMNPQAQVNEFSLVPEKATGYVPFGNFADVRSIIASKKFYPVYITGLSGNGKTMMVEQVCAQEKRECVRVNITIETDEDDLIGGFRLQDGKTVWQNGPIVVAMERGAVLLLDEVDLGSNKLMCLQPVLEGKPIYLKKINKVITPAAGFNIIATANTKGKGSDDGRFIGTNVMNEAFLERFSITMEQEYPSTKIETKIITNVLKASGMEDKDFVEKLVTWADVIRKSFFEGAVSEIISTRRLVHICEAFAIFNDREKAVTLCLNRFDVDTKNSFLDLYKKLDATVDPLPEGAVDPVGNATEEVAF